MKKALNSVLVDKVVAWMKRNPTIHPDFCPIRFENAYFKRLYFKRVENMLRQRKTTQRRKLSRLEIQTRQEQVIEAAEILAHYRKNPPEVVYSKWTP